MQVTQISATIRMSRQLESGSWGTIELSAQATPGMHEPWKTEQATLYGELRAQLACLWKPQLAAQAQTTNGQAQANGQKPAPPPQGPLCPDHGEAKPSSKGTGLYCPVRLDDDTWCQWSNRPKAKAKAKAKKAA